MLDTITLAADIREVKGRKTDSLRVQDLVPAVMYGFKTDPVNIQFNRGDFGRVNEKAGSSSVVQLGIKGAEHPVLIQAIQYDPLTDYVTHVDFRRIDMDQKVETAISIVLEGIAPAVKDLSGVLIQNLEEVEVSALPTALVREFVLDVSGLTSFEDILRVSDIKVPEGVEILTDQNRTVVIIQEPRKVEVETPVASEEEEETEEKEEEVKEN